MVEMRQMMQQLDAKMEPAHPDHPAPHDSFSMQLDAKMEVVNQISLSQTAMMRQAFAVSHLDFMTPADYSAFVAWPGNQAHTTGGGATSSRAQAMEEDGTEEDSDAGIDILEEDEDSDAEEGIIETEVEDDDDDEDKEDDD
ncbi:hypothetical protein V8G54_005444 [Vigna mungo]|uniref:Uncharacterized protein n=1 Tax=Vigna mungo TaxID=3915 RepID=A0AAQ3S5I6_VIGMU